MATNTNQKLAVLIDADNAQASVIQELLAEVSRYMAPPPSSAPMMIGSPSIPKAAKTNCMPSLTAATPAEKAFDPSLFITPWMYRTPTMCTDSDWVA